MNRVKKYINMVVRMLTLPIRENWLFFLAMYAIGMICTLWEVPNNPKAHPYELWALELFLDTFVVCCIICLLARLAGRWKVAARNVLSWVLAIPAYAVTIIDIFCWERFNSSITPTMLLLVGETNSDEAGDFLSSCLDADVLLGGCGIIVLVMLMHIVIAVLPRFIRWRSEIKRKEIIKPVTAAIVAGLFIWAAVECWDNKVAMKRLMSYDTIGEVEHDLTQRNRANLYLPSYRLVFSAYANALASKQLDRLIEKTKEVRVDSCAFTSPNIVLIIGESYNKHHSQLYGYDRKTTPRQMKRKRRGELTVIEDAIAPWNLTSFVFKHLLTTYAVGDKGEWCDYALFPQLFKQAGYHVTFLTNQFLPEAKEAVYDFSGGFFINNPELDKLQFDTRNKELHYFDEDILKDYDRLKDENKEHNLLIFHLKGQHMDYRQRCPKSKQRWNKDAYMEARPDLSEKNRRILAYYDNSVLYNDSIVDQVIRRFQKDDAIVIYFADHGEDMFGYGSSYWGRNHTNQLNWKLLEQEFEIPMWIWCSREYRRKHPDIVRAVREARKKPFMTDALSHMLLKLGGISTPHYRADLDLLDSAYNSKRKRIVKNIADFDEIMKNKTGEKPY